MVDYVWLGHSTDENRFILCEKRTAEDGAPACWIMECTFPEDDHEIIREEIIEAFKRANKRAKQIPLGYRTRVRATQGIKDIAVGDTGVVTAAWTRAIVLVEWDKDGLGRSIHRKRLELCND